MSVILITGCSTGIGMSAALYLAKQGHKVYATMRNPPGSELPIMSEEQDLPIEILRLDVTEEATIKDAVSHILQEEGQIDVLINNAGISSVGAVEELSIDTFTADMETNYIGTVRCIKAVLPSMRSRRSGMIINLSSVAGKVYCNFHGSYAPSKAAVEAMSEALAQEVEQFGIKIFLVEPGIIDTPVFSKNYEMPEQTEYPLIKRFLSLFAAAVDNHTHPDEVAKVIGEIVDGKRTSFRNHASPDATALIGWRASQTDEEWLASTGIDDETWMTAMEQGMNLQVRRYMNDPSLIDFHANKPVPVV